MEHGIALLCGQPPPLHRWHHPAHPPHPSHRLRLLLFHVLEEEKGDRTTGKESVSRPNMKSTYLSKSVDKLFWVCLYATVPKPLMLNEIIYHEISEA